MTKEEISSVYDVDLDTVMRFGDIGLVIPKRMEDGSLVYSEANGEMFQRLFLLERMGFSANDFYKLRSREKTLQELIERQIGHLQDGSFGKEICRQILEEGADLQSFDAKKYLDQLNVDSLEDVFSFNKSYGNQVFRPWRRYFARIIDVSIYNLIWTFFIGYVGHVNLSNENFAWQIADIVITVAMMVMIEPFLLNRFGTTFGKWIFGLRVEKADGTPLTYGEGLKRTWIIMGKGFGYWIPIYNLVRLYKSYRLCKDEEVQPWDEGVAYTIKDTKWYRGVACIVVNVILFFVLIVLMRGQLLPPNRGDITLDQFAQNYNYFCNYLDINEGWYMDEKGQFVEKPSYGAISIDILDHSILDNKKHDFEYEINNGYLTGVSFLYEVENKDLWVKSEKIEPILIALAFGSTDKEVGIFANNAGSILEKMNSDTDFDFTVGNCRYFCDVEQEGYEGSYLMTPIEDGERAYYKMEFSVTKEK